MDQHVAKVRGTDAGLLLAEETELPDEVAYLLTWYYELAGNGNLTFSEIQSWSNLKKTFPEPFEVDALMTLDRLRRVAEYETLKKETNN
mgnify:CR=1 FL=1